LRTPKLRKNEKRQFARSNTRPDIFAALGRDFSRVGRVKDVSLGGLAFEYIAVEDKENDLSCIDVFATKSGLYFPKIPCRMIYEFSREDESSYGFLPSELRTRRCGVAFTDLNEGELAQIKHLVESYTTNRIRQ
jgi:hypothetical protein